MPQLANLFCLGVKRFAKDLQFACQYIIPINYCCQSLCQHLACIQLRCSSAEVILGWSLSTLGVQNLDLCREAQVGALDLVLRHFCLLMPLMLLQIYTSQTPCDAWLSFEATRQPPRMVRSCGAAAKRSLGERWTTQTRLKDPEAFKIYK